MMPYPTDLLMPCPGNFSSMCLDVVLDDSHMPRTATAAPTTRRYVRPVHRHVRSVYRLPQLDDVLDDSPLPCTGSFLTTSFIQRLVLALHQWLATCTLAIRSCYPPATYY